MERRCDICQENEAIYTDYSRGVSLCTNCLKSSIRRRAWAVLENELQEGDKIVVAHSGGKDSSLALYITKEFIDTHPDMKLNMVSLTIDEGTFYRKASIELAKKLAEKLGIRYIVFTMEDIHGISIEDIKVNIPKNWRRSVCTYCGVLRRQAINAVARELGASVVITGHNLDDIVQTSVMNIARGDVNALVKTLRHERRIGEGLIPRIRPLKYVYEREVAALVIALGIPAHLGKCPFTQGMRIGIRRVIDELEDEASGSKIRALRSFYLITRSIRPRIEIKRCKVCGEPTTADLCKACQFKRELSEFFGKDLLKPPSFEKAPSEKEWIWSNR